MIDLECRAVMGLVLLFVVGTACSSSKGTTPEEGAGGAGGGTEGGGSGTGGSAGNPTSRDDGGQIEAGTDAAETPPDGGAVQLSIFSTAVDDSGTALAGGLSDPHYQVSASNDPSHSAPRPAITVTGELGGYVPNSPKAGWISLQSDRCQAGCGGPFIYDYETTFTMPAGADLSTAVLSADVAGDDDVSVILNGAEVFASLGTGPPWPWEATKHFQITPGLHFTSGTNTLILRVHNANGSTGVRMSNVVGIVTVR